MGNDVTVGMRHGHLTVLQELSSINGHRLFGCRCDCGKDVILRGSHFYPSRLFCSRGCPKRIPDWSGRRFGRWTVLEKADRQIVGGRLRVVRECQCDCGTRRIISSQMLEAGQSLSCGCALLEKITVHRTPESKLAAKRAASRKCAHKNPARMKAHKIKYEAQRAKATPPWLTSEQWAEMNAIYEKARKLTLETGIRHEVDHIHPLNGKNLSGLHVPWNLQILTQSENVSKSNRYAELPGNWEK